MSKMVKDMPDDLFYMQERHFIRISNNFLKMHGYVMERQQIFSKRAKGNPFLNPRSFVPFR